MGDPLSIAAGAVGIISLGIQVSEGLIKYYSAYRNQTETVKAICDNLESLNSSLQLLTDTISVRKFQPLEQNMVVSINNALHSCEEFIQDLQDDCDKIQKSPKGDWKAALHSMGRRAAFPFRESTLKRLEESIQAIKENLMLALDVLQLRDNQMLQDDVRMMKELIELMQTTQLSADMTRWLSAPDATINHNIACAKRHPGTGRWFIRSSQFENWMQGREPFLWINGFAGSGKSVLCSTAIQTTLRRQPTNARVGIAFFYFAFNDITKQDNLALLKAIVLQLSSQASAAPTDLVKLYSSYKTTTPSEGALLDCIHKMISQLDHFYLLIDAIDEVPKGRPRRAVLETIDQMRKWSGQSRPLIHMLCSSRSEVDIADSFEAEQVAQVAMRNSEVDLDIQEFVTSSLKTDTRLQKWKAHHDRIRTVLTSKAHGVFRWVECQLAAIKECPRSPRRLEQCLQDLPEDLDQTYERILCGIGKDSVKDALRILSVLCIAQRPLTVNELVDAVAIDLDESAQFDRDLRYGDADSLLEVCPGLIEVYLAGDDVNLSAYMLHDHHSIADLSLVRIAHFSVQEYLQSTRIKLQRSVAFAIDIVSVHADMVRMCLAYILELAPSQSTLKITDLEDLPFIRYAAEFWNFHYTKVTLADHDAHKVVMNLFLANSIMLKHWERLRSGGAGDYNCVLTESEDRLAPPIYCAALLGLSDVVDQLVGAGADVYATSVWSYGRSALCAASQAGHLKIVRRLMTFDTVEESEIEQYANALSLASGQGHLDIVQALLNSGKIIDSQCRQYTTAMFEAARRGHKQVLEVLMHNIPETKFPTGGVVAALAGACSGGHRSIVQLFMDRHVDVNAYEDTYGGALCAASGAGQTQTVRLLLENGAHVNAVGKRNQNALCAAIECGHVDIVRLLLASGADVNIRGGKQGTALSTAIIMQNLDIARILLEHEADPNAPGKDYGSLIARVVARRQERMARLLLQYGADANAPGEAGKTALQWATESGFVGLAELLVQHGAVTSVSEKQ